MMPGIIISFIFSEQLSLIFWTAPMENKLACPVKLLDDTPNRLCIQIRAANLPWSARSCLLALQQACLHQTFDRTVTHATHPSRFAQADSFRIE